jgi:hypothetical protein
VRHKPVRTLCSIRPRVNRNSEIVPTKSPAASALVLVCVWLLLVSAAVYVWNCASRQGATLEPATLDAVQGSTVTGYTTHVGGTVLYYAIMLTLIGFQILLLGLAIASYGANQEPALKLFEIIWSIGFIYTLAFKYPKSIRTVFWKTCRLHDATYVGVYVPPKQQLQEQYHASDMSRGYVLKLRRWSYTISICFHRLMQCVFPRGHAQQFFPVRVDAKGTRYFSYDFCRYNYNAELNAFEPGVLQVVHSLGDVVNAKDGLKDSQVEERLRVVGPNTIEMPRPNLFRAVVEEFSKPFYVYQNYMLWTWVPLYYYYLALIHATVIITGGLTVSWFKFRNESNLFKLTHVEGQADCLRNGEFVSIPQSDLVPGDIVVVGPGKTYSDMLMVNSRGLLVDESALTGESTPMAKSAVDPLDHEVEYNALLHKKHLISAGTTVVESEVEHSLAVVLSTGSFTSKGQLLREVFAYERHEFKFDIEVGYVIGLLFVEAIIGFILVTTFLHEQPVYGWFYGM